MATRNGIHPDAAFKACKFNLHSRIPARTPDRFAADFEHVIADMKKRIKEMIREQNFRGASASYSELYEMRKVATVGHLDRLVLGGQYSDTTMNWGVSIAERRGNILNRHYSWDISPSDRVHATKWVWNGSRFEHAGVSRLTMQQLAQVLERRFSHGEDIIRQLRDEVNSQSNKIRHRLFRIAKEDFYGW